MVGGAGLTVHVLDTARGLPAIGLCISLWRIAGEARIPLGAWRTNRDGRCDAPILDAASMRVGTYEVVFDVAGWRLAEAQADTGFYDLVSIRFVVADAGAHYHIPLLLSPYGYSTYRGS